MHSKIEIVIVTVRICDDIFVLFLCLFVWLIVYLFIGCLFVVLLGVYLSFNFFPSPQNFPKEEFPWCLSPKKGRMFTPAIVLPFLNGRLSKRPVHHTVGNSTHISLFSILIFKITDLGDRSRVPCHKALLPLIYLAILMAHKQKQNSVAT